MTAPRIYAAIAAITADLARSGIAKTQLNQAEGYAYRGIDEVCNRLAPLLAQHRVCILPRVLERVVCECAGDALIRVAVHVAYDSVSARDGSSHTIESYGEALDGSDKATAKAMSSAYKQAVTQAFCIPIQRADDPDASSRRVASRHIEAPDPDQGWEQWGLDMAEMIRACETGEALDRVQATYRAQLRAASKRQPQVYSAIGVDMQARREALAPRHTQAGVSAADGAQPPTETSLSLQATVPAKVPAHA